MRHFAALSLSAPLLWALGVSVGHAQDVDVALPDSGLFARDQNVTVLERQNSEYSFVPTHIGGFLIDPSITSEFDYNSNIYAAGSGPGGNSSASGVAADEIWQIDPALVVESDWGRNYLSLTLSGEHTSYLHYSSQDTSSVTVSSLARWDVFHDFGLAGGFDLAHETEARTAINSPAAAVKPITYDYANGFIDTVKQDDRIKLALRADLQDYAYQNGTAANGATLYQRDQDYTEVTVNGRAEYAYDATAAFFLAGSGDQQYYRNPLPGERQRDSTGYTGEAGANLNLTDLLKGQFGLGYIAQHYRYALYPNISGLDASANLTYLMTTLFNVTLTASRSVQNSVIPEVGGYLASTVGGEIDYELLRNFRIIGTLGYENDAFRDYGRTDGRVSAGLQATWMLNRALWTRLGYTYYKVDSSGTERIPDYAISDVQATVIYNF